MDLELLQSSKDQILNCNIQDENGLNDFQKLPDENATRIDQVGIERFRLPITLSSNDKTTHHDAEASMFVSLKEGKTGVNMSRFCKILQTEAEQNKIDSQFFDNVINSFRHDLRDYDHEDPIEDAFLSLSFNYPLKQKSLKSDNWGWQYYKCKLSGKVVNGSATIMNLEIHYEYSSTCPCSLSMSKQYERDFEQGKTNEGSGIAAAHGQRSEATCELEYSTAKPLSIEEAINLIRLALPTETQSLVKRVDEQAFAILNGDHPMFVEHASRRLATVFDSEERILDWKAKVEHFESLHSHNAVAIIKKKHSQN